MIRKACRALAVVTLFVGCLGKTTSLGGPEGNQSSASSTDPDGPLNLIAPPTAPDDSGVVVGDAATGPSCGGGYTWAPAASSAPCEYFLPSPLAPPTGDLNFDPKTWNVADVQIFVQDPSTSIWPYWGSYVGSADGCAGSDGWYYTDGDPDAGQTPTLFAICPKSCANAAHEGAWVRLNAQRACP